MGNCALGDNQFPTASYDLQYTLRWPYIHKIPYTSELLSFTYPNNVSITVYNWVYREQLWLSWELYIFSNNLESGFLVGLLQIIQQSARRFQAPFFVYQSKSKQVEVSRIDNAAGPFHKLQRGDDQIPMERYAASFALWRQGSRILLWTR